MTVENDKSNQDLSLVSVFEKGQVAQRVKDLIAQARIIQGGHEMGLNQGYVTRHMKAEDRVIEWQVKGKPSVYLLPPSIGAGLIEHLGLPVGYTNFYDPGKRVLDRVRQGQLMLGFKRHYGLHHYMVAKDAVTKCIDPAAMREAAVKQDLVDLQLYLAQSGQTMGDVLVRLREQDDNKPAPNGPSVD